MTGKELVKGVFHNVSKIQGSGHNIAADLRKIQFCIDELADVVREYNQIHEARRLRMQIKMDIKIVDLPATAVCEECGRVYVPRQKNQRFCSEKCNSRARARRYYHRKKASDSVYGG